VVPFDFPFSQYDGPSGEQGGHQRSHIRRWSISQWKEGQSADVPPENGRWLTELEDGTHKLIRIQNLEYRGTLRICFSVQGLDRVRAGMMAGDPALMIFDNPKRSGFNLELMKEKFLLIGVPFGLLERLLDNHPAFLA
jgi:hypothetical protein